MRLEAARRGFRLPAVGYLPIRNLHDVVAA